MTFALGLGIMGFLMLYTGFKNVSFANAISGNLTPDQSSAGQLSAAVVGKPADTPALTGGGSSIPGASWNPLHKPIAKWIVPELAWASQHGWHGYVVSGVRTKAEQTIIYQSGVRPAAKPGKSNHEQTEYPGGAVDVTNPRQLAEVLKRKPGGSPLEWAGAKDPPHFSHPHDGGY